MKISIILCLFVALMISGCMENPLKEVPVVMVNITFSEKDGTVIAENYDLKQASVNYLNRPTHTQAESFPAISARTSLLKDKNSSIGPWEMIPFKGNGTYSFNIGFKENRYPAPNDTVHVSIIVVDEKGERIGYVIDNLVWK